MKRFLPLLALAMLLGGCGVTSIGLPTAAVNLKSSTVTTTTIGTTVTGYVRNVILEFRTQPGSPAGTVASVTDQNGNSFVSSVYLESCPTSSTKECGPYSFTLSIPFADAASEPKIVLFSYQVVGNNGATSQVNFPGGGIPIN